MAMIPAVVVLIRYRDGCLTCFSFNPYYTLARQVPVITPILQAEKLKVHQAFVLCPLT